MRFQIIAFMATFAPLTLAAASAPEPTTGPQLEKRPPPPPPILSKCCVSDGTTRECFIYGCPDKTSHNKMLNPTTFLMAKDTTFTAAVRAEQTADTVAKDASEN